MNTLTLWSSATSFDLSEMDSDYMDALEAIRRESNLVKLIQNHNLKARHYCFLTQSRYIEQQGDKLVLLANGARWLEKNRTPLRTTGDQVTLTSLRPRIGRKGYTWGHWIAETDDAAYFEVTLYSEDFTAIERAGYPVPHWNDRPNDSALDEPDMLDIALGNVSGFESKGKKQPKVKAAKVASSIEVILKPEQVAGHWRIDKVLPAVEEIRFITIDYKQVEQGDTIQNGAWGNYEVLSIVDTTPGTRVATVKDEDGQRDIRMTSNGSFTLVKGRKLDAARNNRKLIEWAGSGWRWAA